MDNILDFIKPELVILIPVLYLIGMGLKKLERIRDGLIPVLLGLAGIALAVIWVFATAELSGIRAICTAVFTAVTQGILCAGCSVYCNQLIKQTGRT